MRYQSNRPKRQFLAGVKCPKCENVDKIVHIQIFEPIADEYIECIICGHTERRPTPNDLAKTNNAMIDEIQPVVFK